MTGIINILTDDLGLEMDPTKAFTHFECPECQHHNSKFGISAVHGGYRCFHCGVSGNFYQLLVKIFGWEPYQAKLAVGLVAPSDLVTSDDEPEVVLVRPLEWDDQLFSASKLNYLMGRGFSKEEVEMLMMIYPMWYSRLPKWDDCLIFERRDEDDNFIGYWGKNIVNKQPRNQYGVPIETMWGAEAIGNTGEMLFVTEGVFDALRVQMVNLPYSSVVAFGGTGSGKQVEHLKKLSERYTRTVLLLDNDDEGRKATAKLLDMVPGSVAATLPDGVSDPAELSTEQCRAFLQEIV